MWMLLHDFLVTLLLSISFRTYVVNVPISNYTFESLANQANFRLKLQHSVWEKIIVGIAKLTTFHHITYRLHQLWYRPGFGLGNWRRKRRKSRWRRSRPKRPWWRIGPSQLQEKKEKASPSNHLHILPIRRTRKGLQRCPLPRCLCQRNVVLKDWPTWR